MKKYLLTFLTLGLLLCEASFTGGGMAFAATSYTLSADHKTLTITGSGAMTDWTSSNYTNATTGRGWQSNIGTITKIVISEGVSSVGAYAFRGMTEVTTVEVASTVTSIGSYAFYGCSKLATVKFGTSSTYKCNIDTIQSSAFSSCTAVANVYCYGSSYADAMARWLHIGFNAATSNPFNASTVATKYFNMNTSRQTSLSTYLNGATAIKQYAFYNNTSLTAITLPTSLIWIGKQAFGKCSNSSFTKITIPENVTICGDDVFTGCSALTSVVWNATNCTQYQPGGTYTSTYFPFWNPTLSGQITSFTFGDNVTTIPPVICSKMANLPTIVIPASVTSIGAETFKGCTSLASIVSLATTPPTVANVNAFTNVTKSIPVVVTSTDAVTSYSGATGWSDFTNITTVLSGSCGDNATYALDFATGTLTISGTGAMTDYSTSDSNRSPWYKFNSYITDIVVSSGITAIGNAAFANCDVETCTLPASVTNFVTQCFFGVKVNELYYEGTLDQWCNITRGTNNPHPVTQKLYINSSEITSLTIPSITSLAAKAFMNMKGITAVTVPVSITTIGADAFSGCSNIANVYYQGSLAQWCAISFSNDQEANPAFNGASLHIDDSDIDDGAVFVKDAIASISNYAFCGVTNYTSIDINAATTVGAYTFKNCTAQILYRGSANGTSGNVTWTWEDGILTLSGSGTMNNYTSAANVPWTPYMGSTHEIIVEDGITSIGNYAFNSPAASPVTVTLPSTGLTTIGNSSFSGLTALRELTIPNGVTNIGTNAFSSCTNLEKIYCPSTVPTLTNAAGGGYTVYNSFASNAPFYVLPASYASYTSSTWTSFGSNFFIYGDCGADSDSKNVQWVLSSKTGVMSFIGSGNVRGYGNGTTPWYSLRAMILSAEFSEGITATGGWCFQDCSNLATVSLPSTLTIVSVRTFNATAITSIDIPEGVTRVNNYAFYNCTALEDVNLPSTLTQIGSNVFEGCTGLASIDLPEGLTNIGSKAFAGCTSLASITIPRSVTTISTSSGSYTFNGCTALRTVNWNAEECANFNKYSSDGKSFTYYTPFGNTKASITAFNFGPNVRVIPSCLCEGMTALTSVTLPSSVTTINQDVFHGCTGLTSVTIPAAVTSIGGTVFEGCTGITSVTSNAVNPPTIQSSTFPSAVESAATLYVPATVASRNAYTSDTYWREFDHILPYVITFDLQDHGDDIDAICVNAGRVDDAQKPTDPEEEYYTFGGWYTNAGCTTPFTFGESGTVVNSDLTLYAKWTEDLHSVTVAYMCGEATIQASGSVSGVGVATAQDATALSIAGYTFSTWSAMPSGVTTSDELTSATISINATADGQIITANYTINNYTVSFNLQGHGTAIAAQSVDYNGTASQPADPEADYFTFGGWFDNEGCTGSPFDFSTPITADLTLYALWTENIFSFADTDNNTAKILAANGKLASSITIGRTIWRDGYYNSMCLPFSLTSEQLAASPLAGYKALKRLSEATITGEDENRELNIQLEPITEITAGEPFFISYEVGLNITNPEFTDVTVTAPAPNAISKGDVTCRGLYTSTDLGTATTNLFLGANNVLYWPAEGQSTIKGLRAYFVINPGAPAKSGMRVRLSDKPAEVPTALEETNLDSRTTMHKYIRDGVLFIERDGKTYNAQGVLVH